MRVVAGSYKGRRLSAPAGLAVRPTSDRVREAVFDILTHRGDVTLHDARVLDAFAGTGAMGIEALSRGAANAFFLDRDPRALAVCRANLESLGCDPARWSVLESDCLDPLPADAPCSLVFLDPPYGAGLAEAALTALTAAGWIATGSACVIEVGAKESVTPPAGFGATDERQYGAARIVFLTCS